MHYRRKLSPLTLCLNLDSSLLLPCVSGFLNHACIWKSTPPARFCTECAECPSTRSTHVRPDLAAGLGEGCKSVLERPRPLHVEDHYTSKARYVEDPCTCMGRQPSLTNKAPMRGISDGMKAAYSPPRALMHGTASYTTWTLEALLFVYRCLQPRQMVCLMDLEWISQRWHVFPNGVHCWGCVHPILIFPR